jgi:hypothetical protein
MTLLPKTKANNIASKPLLYTVYQPKHTQDTNPKAIELERGLWRSIDVSISLENLLRWYFLQRWWLVSQFIDY